MSLAAHIVLQLHDSTVTSHGSNGGAIESHPATRTCTLHLQRNHHQTETFPEQILACRRPTDPPIQLHRTPVASPASATRRPRRARQNDSRPNSCAFSSWVKAATAALYSPKRSSITWRRRAGRRGVKVATGLARPMRPLLPSSRSRVPLPVDRPPIPRKQTRSRRTYSSPSVRSRRAALPLLSACSTPRPLECPDSVAPRVDAHQQNRPARHPSHPACPHRATTRPDSSRASDG